MQTDWHKGAMQLAETANKFSGQLFIVLIKRDRNEIYTYFVAVLQQQVFCLLNHKEYEIWQRKPQPQLQSCQ